MVVSMRNLVLVMSAVCALAVTPGVSLAAPKAKPVATSPYVCTPSGFGQKARCYLRATQPA